MNAQRQGDSDPGSSREPPVEWDRLKQMQDEHAAPRISVGAVVAVFLAGLSVLGFLLAFYFALDPSEYVEPARYVFFTALGLAFLSGWAAVAFLHRRSGE